MDNLKYVKTHVKQVWLADDATGVGRIASLKVWWDILIDEGRKLGYFVNEKKSWLIVKNEDSFQKALDIFKDSDIKFTLEGKRHLGAAIGSDEFKNNYMKEK